ncbi:unnamed protein product [Rotaria sp. Silwood2]|nr:unnamed protein product [Rotaria sp. Silwood2]CAF3968950.1 unnamed protein product [Rotaria sp. Silwood2]
MEPIQGTTYHFAEDNPTSTSYQTPISVTATNAPPPATEAKPSSASAPAPAPSLDDKGAMAALVACACCAGGAVVCCGACMIFFAAFSFIIPILEIIIAREYKDECPAKPAIPHFLYLAGILGLFPIILSIATTCIGCCVSQEQNPNSKTIRLLSLILRVLSATAQILLVIFLIYLIVITFSIYGKVQYDRREEEATYCRKALYRFAIFICILNILTALFLCCGGSRAPQKRKKTETNQNANSDTNANTNV